MSDSQRAREPQEIPCRNCGGERLVADLGVHLQTSQVGLKASVGFLGGYSPLLAIVCTVCGYTDFFAAAPQSLIERRRDKPIKDRDK